MSGDKAQLAAAINRLSDQEQADILFFSGAIERHRDNEMIQMVMKRKRRDNVVLVLVTPGGDADAAYRMARVLQDNYKKVIVFVSGWCKSAGTLLAIGAHEIVMSPCGELGPLDVQLGKRDELFEYGSGLDLESAMIQLNTIAFAMFENYMLAIERASGARVSFKTASQYPPS